MEQIVIIKQDGTRVPLNRRGAVRAVSSAEQTWTINADDTLNIVVTSVEPQAFDVGDMVKIFGRVYKLNRLPKVKKTGAHRFEYTLDFEGVQYDLMAATFDVNIDTTNNELQDVWGDALTGDLSRFMSVLIANVNRIFPGKWAVGSVIETDGDITMTFGESDNCLSVLQSLCNKFECEFEIITNDTDVNVINMVKHVGRTLPHTFRHGHGGGLYELRRENVTSSNIVTRLKVYGSNENITSKYRADRLCLPGCSKSQSIIQDERMVAKYGVYEGKKFFNVKPTFTGNVEQVFADDVLSFVDSNIVFDLNAKDKDGNTIYLISGQAAKVHFNSGNLAGYEFDVQSYDHDSHKITLKRSTDDRGMRFPSDTSAAFRFTKGNEYKLLNINMPRFLIDEAEKELQKTATEWYNQNCQPKVQYALTLEKLYLQRKFGASVGTVNLFTPGDNLHVIDEDIAVDKDVRVKSIKRDVLNEYDYTLTLSDTVTTPVTSRVLAKLAEIEKVIAVNKLNDVARAKRNWQTSREVLDMVFDADGDYYSGKIKPLSVDTGMLAVGARSMQLSYDGLFKPNHNKDANSFAWSEGVLAHFTIENEIRDWLIPPGEINDLPSGPLYLYAHCGQQSSIGEIILQEEQIKVNGIPKHYTFLLGILSSPMSDSDGREIRTLSLTYGTTTINGRTIQTGIIRSSGGGSAYFDLDNNEIGGVIKFRKGDGTYINVADVDVAAAKAKDAADAKRRVFTNRPNPPYDVGDMWVDGKELRTCVAAKTTTESYNMNDWDIRVGYDNTQTVIDGGLVTSGTIQVAGDASNILAGVTGDGTTAQSVRFWGGASFENRATAPFRVLQDGTFFATKGNITGKVNAKTGAIGGFEIASGRIGADSEGTAESGRNLTLKNDFIKFADAYRWASIGTNVLPDFTGMIGVGRFNNETPNPGGVNHGLFINVAGALHNMAIVANGTISATNIFSQGFARINPSASTCDILGDMTEGGFARVLATFTNRNSGIGFPRRQIVASVLGIGQSTPFWFDMTVTCAVGSTQEGYIVGYNTFAPGMRSQDYPLFINKYGGYSEEKLVIKKGEVHQFVLVYDGSRYYAYEKNPL